ncbi:hypothetical protein B566_EDAN005027 [Ephemera danica]|nr:hypothetical protein B566_EDAN005027 [Ephemera danica]
MITPQLQVVARQHEAVQTVRLLHRRHPGDLVHVDGRGGRTTKNSSRSQNNHKNLLQASSDSCLGHHPDPGRRFHSDRCRTLLRHETCGARLVGRLLSCLLIIISPFPSSLSSSYLLQFATKLSAFSTFVNIYFYVTRYF